MDLEDKIEFFGKPVCLFQKRRGACVNGMREDRWPHEIIVKPSADEFAGVFYGA